MLNKISLSENSEALYVLLTAVVAAILGFLTDSSIIPLPLDAKLSLVALIGAVFTALFTYWKTRINVKEA